MVTASLVSWVIVTFTGTLLGSVAPRARMTSSVCTAVDGMLLLDAAEVDSDDHLLCRHVLDVFHDELGDGRVVVLDVIGTTTLSLALSSCSCSLLLSTVTVVVVSVTVFVPMSCSLPSTMTGSALPVDGEKPPPFEVKVTATV